MVSYSLLSSGDGACTATMLDFDGEVRVLADPGWNGQNPADIRFLERHLGHVDLIILSHSTPEFVGAYVLLCVQFPILMRAIPVYATLAVSQLARVATVEFYRSRGVLGPVSSAMLEVGDVDEWYDRVTAVKYAQNVSLLERRIVLTAYAAGHTLGGAFWSVVKRTEKVVYAPAWNHSRDSFLNSAGFLSAGSPVPGLLRPTTLITGTDLGSAAPHTKRAEAFLQLVSGTLANGGAVVLPVAVSGRFLELLHLVDGHLQSIQGAAIPVYLLSYSGTKVLSYAANLVDWMASHLAQEYASAADLPYARAPLEPTKVDLLGDARELVRLPGPKIVFASGLSMRPGDLSLPVLQFLCQDEKSTLLLTERPSASAGDPLAAELYEEWRRLAVAKRGVAEDGVPVPLEKTVAMDTWLAEENLTGAEKDAFTSRVNEARREKLLEKVRDKKNATILNEESSSDDSSGEEPEMAETKEDVPETGAAAAPAGTSDVLKTHDMFVGDYVSESLANNKPIDIRVTVRMRPKQAQFPFVAAKKRKIDDYGAVIDPKDFQSADDSSANNKLISESKRKFELHDKGKWGEGRRGRKDERRTAENRLTPQEALNNEVLQRNLDALFRPVKRVPFREVSPQNLLLKLRCGLSFVDLSGLVDLRSLVMIVSVLRPQNVVLLPDSSHLENYAEQPDGRQLLVAAFDKQKSEKKSKLASDSLLSSTRFNALTSTYRGSKGNSEMKVYEAQPNKTTQVGDGAGRFREFEVKLDEQLDSALTWQKLGSHRITKVTGELGIYESQLLLSKQHAELALSSQFVLKPVEGDSKGTQEIQGASRGFGSSLAIGNVRLPELKRKLVGLDLDAEFKGEGTLVVNDEIAIKKVAMGAFQGEDTGDLVIDGQIGPLYYKVKKCIKEMLAFV